MCWSTRRSAWETPERYGRIVAAALPPAVALIAGGCSQLPGDLPSMPGVDPTGVWLPFWVVALAGLPLIVVAFYFGLRKIAQPFLKYLILVYTAFISAQAGLLWFEEVSITGKFAGNMPWLSRTTPAVPSPIELPVPAAAPSTGVPPSTPPARQAKFEVQVQVRQAGGELALVKLLFAGIGLAGWRRLHADAETTAATLVRGKLSIGDLHAGLLNGVRGSMAIAWAVRKLQPNQISSAALADQLGSVYFCPPTCGTWVRWTIPWRPT